MKKKRLSTIILILVFLAGLSLLLYPTISDYWNSLHQSQAIAEYAEAVNDLDEEEYARMLEAARQYNKELNRRSDRFHMTKAEQVEYEALLNVSGNGILGYVEIPSIDCALPVYHGTEESVLQIAVGHLYWSSLPVGGESTHAVLSGHRGLPSAKLFTNLDQLAEGDVFMIRVLDETLTYEVDQIRIVLPKELDALQIETGKDLCTLVTCTPYGINTHRLLVRGHRIPNRPDAGSARVTADAMQIEPALMAPLIAAPMLLILLLILLISTRRKCRR